MENSDFSAYIQPELLMLIPPVYVAGVFLKRTGFLKDKYIPLALGGLSFLLCLFYFISEAEVFNGFVLMGMLPKAFVQGLLVAACTVYGHQISKQWSKKEE